MSLYKDCPTCNGLGRCMTCIDCGERDTATEYLHERCSCGTNNIKLIDCPDCNETGRILKHENDTKEDY